MRRGVGVIPRVKKKKALQESDHVLEMNSVTGILLVVIGVIGISFAHLLSKFAPALTWTGT